MVAEIELVNTLRPVPRAVMAHDRFGEADLGDDVEIDRVDLRLEVRVDERSAYRDAGAGDDDVEPVLDALLSVSTALRAR